MPIWRRTTHNPAPAQSHAPQADQGFGDSTIRDWADSQIAPWRKHGLSAERVAARIDELATEHQTLFKLTLSGGRVSLTEKPTIFPSEADGRPHPFAHRAAKYRDFLQAVVSAYDLPFEGTLAIDVNDGPFSVADIPVFGFQKLHQTRLILLPDVDMLTMDFFVADKFQDTVPFDRKQESAIFVGSTSGGGIITKEAVTDHRTPRIASAVFFRDVPDVTFELAQIVQCDSEATAEMIKSLGVIHGPRTHAEQFAHKVLLSMDGNGATCSRVTLALASNCVLTKYDSPYVLYFFDRLKPWINYIPISRDDDVIDLMRDLAIAPEFYRSVAETSKAFASRYLTRIATFEYVAELLRQYDSLLSNEETLSAQRSFLMDASFHMQGVGTRWSNIGGWAGTPSGGLALEGFTVFPSTVIAPEDVQCRYLSPDGVTSFPANAAVYCGTKAQHQPLHGFSISLTGRAAAEYQISYEATFRDKTSRDPMPGGQMCRSASNAPLEAFKIHLKPKL